MDGSYYFGECTPTKKEKRKKSILEEMGFHWFLPPLNLFWIIRYNQIQRDKKKKKNYE